MRVESHPDADAELAEAVRYIEENRPGYGARFYEAFETAAGRLRKYPEIGPRRTPRARRKRVMGFPYDIVYRILSDRIVIVAISHHSRGPEYFRDVLRRR